MTLIELTQNKNRQTKRLPPRFTVSYLYNC